MKKLYTILALIATITIFAQAPQGFNYQATVRNSAGALIVNQNVNFKFNIMLNSATSLPVFSETHMAPTDDLGQVNLIIGTGTATVGTFSTINWGTGNYYLGIELNTGAGYVAMGTTQLLSVPYALYANSAGNSQAAIPNLASVLAVNNSANNTKITNLADPTDAQDATTKQYVDSKIPNGTNVGDNLTWNGTNWVVTSANTSAQLPQLTTSSATGITPFAATSGGTITGDGGFSIISKGVAWSTSPNPTINDNFTNNGSGATSFQSVLNNLLPGTSYYYRAYATNTVGTGYGMSFSLTTQGLSTLITTEIMQISSNSASSGGNITSNGGANVTARGVCWSTSPNPTIALSTKTVNGSGSGLFSSSITQLTPATTYYVRAYATNAAGTAYGNELSFTTSVALPTLTTSAATAITSSTASSGGSITSDGGGAITVSGIVWGTTTNPTLVTNIGSTTDGTLSGTFTSNLSGLTPGTTYYVRAYATNSAGTAYGNQITFTTDIANITIGSQIWSITNLDVTTYRDGTPIPQVTDPSAWASLTTGAWCYYNNDPANNATYGKLYNWYAVAGIYDAASLNNPSLRKQFAPQGWHIPSDAEWTILTDFLGGESVAGGKMKSTGTIQAGTGLWESPNAAATNESGFTGLPAGYRNYDGTFDYIGNLGIWWSSSEDNPTIAWYRSLDYNYGNAFRFSYYKINGFSVRCVRD
jgi:uncharacterized protein (TIGR02145 family)